MSSTLILLAASLAGGTSAFLSALEVSDFLERRRQRSVIQQRLLQESFVPTDDPSHAVQEDPCTSSKGQQVGSSYLDLMLAWSRRRPFASAVDRVGGFAEKMRTNDALLGRAAGSKTSQTDGRTSVQKTLAQAGLERRFTASDVERMRVMSATSVMVAGLFLGSLLGSLVYVILGSLSGAYLGYRLPVSIISRRAGERLDTCISELPQMIEVIALGSAAGVSFFKGLDLYAQRFSGPLPREIQMTYAAWATGARSQQDALADLAERLDLPALSQFVATSIQAIKMGTPLSETLNAQIEEARRVERAHIEERIAKAPVKMLVPMGTLILPAMLLLVLGPVILGMQGS